MKTNRPDTHSENLSSDPIVYSPKKHIIIYKILYETFKCNIKH